MINADINSLKTNFNEEKSSTNIRTSSLEKKVFDLQGSLVNFEIEHHLKKGQVGAMRKMIKKLEMDIEKGWGEEDTILEIKDYIAEKGMPSFYLSELAEVFKKIPRSLDLIGTEVLELAQKELYDPKTNKK